jgi:hypothetical protein
MPSAAGGPAKNQSFSTVSPGAGNVSKSYTPGAYDDEDNIAESIADLRRLSGLAECGCDDAPMEKQAGKVNVNTTMSTDGTRNINISADGEAADALMQMLKLAGLAGHHDEETVVAIPEGKKPDYLDFDKDGDKKEPMKKALRDKAKVKEEIADEGNEFSGALAKAKAAHKDEFEVGGKTYKVKESAKPDYLDFDRDGNKKEPMKKALRDKKK